MLHIYHPNKAVKGFACSFWFSDRNDSVFATILKQSGWDAANQNGIFKGSLDDPNMKTSIKLSYVEVAAILLCVEKNIGFETFHDHDEAPKTIKFVPWLNQDGSSKGYSFSVTVGNKQDTTFKNSFYIGLTFAEGRYIREFLLHSMHRHFDKQIRVGGTDVLKSEVAAGNDKPTETVTEAAPTREEPSNNPTPTQSNKPVVDPLTDF